MNADDLGMVGPFVAAVKRQNAILLVGGIIVALLLAGIGLAGVTSGRESASASRSGAATAAAADRGAAAAKMAADNAATAATDAKTAADGAAELTRAVNGILDPAGPTAQAQAAQRQQIIDGVTAATNRLAVLVGDNQQLRRQLDAVLAELITTRAQLQTAIAARPPPGVTVVNPPGQPPTQPPGRPTPTTTLPPPSNQVCKLLGPLGAPLGCK